MAVNLGRPIYSEGAEVGISQDGVRFLKIPGVADITPASGSAPTTETQMLGGTRSIIGRLGNGSISFTVPGVALAHETYDWLDDAGRNDKPLFCRLNTADEFVAFQSTSGNTIAIATSGTITPAGTVHADMLIDDIGPGSAFKIEGDQTNSVQNYRVINAITPTAQGVAGPGQVTLKTNPASAVAANTYAVVTPAFRVPAFSVKVTDFTIPTFSAGSSATLSFVLTPSGKIPKPEIGSF